MKDLEFLYAINDIDDEFITEAADDERLKEAFCAEWGEENESEQTESDTAAEEADPKRKSTKRTHKVSFKKLMLVAVIGALIFALSVGALAKYFDINLRDEIYEIIGKTVRVDRQELSAEPNKYTESTSKLVDDLKEKGFENILLPKAILNDDWQFVYVQFNDNFPIIAGANIDLITQKGEVDFILSYIRYEEYKNNEINLETAVKMEEININGVDVVVTLHKSGKKSISYVTREEKDNITEQMEYSFSFSNGYTYEEVLDIAKTIG
ncbi:MAG: hypothetical protein IJW86_02380 [Clostridia bacterium]|nr:hypothetical protein [Clostridia bacterium]